MKWRIFTYFPPGDKCADAFTCQIKTFAMLQSILLSVKLHYTSIALLFKLREWLQQTSTFSSSTRSSRLFPSGSIGFTMRAMMMSMPFDSCLAMHVCRGWNTQSMIPNKVLKEISSHMIPNLKLFPCGNRFVQFFQRVWMFKYLLTMAWL